MRWARQILFDRWMPVLDVYFGRPVSPWRVECALDEWFEYPRPPMPPTQNVMKDEAALRDYLEWKQIHRVVQELMI